jgi:hypothetical protein
MAANEMTKELKQQPKPPLDAVLSDLQDTANAPRQGSKPMSWLGGSARTQPQLRTAVDGPLISDGEFVKLVTTTDFWARAVSHWKDFTAMARELKSQGLTPREIRTVLVQYVKSLELERKTVDER